MVGCIASWCLITISMFQVAIADHDGILTCFGMKKGEAVVGILIELGVFCDCLYSH